ncbi:MAG: carbohydrate porin [Candidatus Omnitrophota bacterium]
MRFLRLGGLLVLFLIFLSGNFVFAASIEDEVAGLKSRIIDLEKSLAEQENKLGQQSEISESLQSIKEAFEGLSIGGGATFVVQGTSDANATTSNGEDITDASYSVDLELEKSFDDGAALFIHLEGGQGAGVMDNDELDLFSGVNKDATGGDAKMELAEAWYEKGFNDNLVVTFGKLDPTGYFDSNAVANDETSQFLAGMFKNSAVLEFPDNGPGIRLGFVPTEKIELGVGILDGDGDWEDVGDDIFIIGEVDFKLNPWGRDGNYRLYGWVNDTDHTRLLDVTKTKEEGYGFGLSFDQELTDILTGFLRFGWQDEEVYDCDMSWSTGLQVAGKAWGRDNDILGLAVGQVMPGDDYAKAGNPDHNEGHFEAYYNIYVNDNFTISPDLQVIWNPKGVGSSDEGRNDTIVVLGARSQISF